jgi:hypothetical protein
MMAGAASSKNKKGNTITDVCAYLDAVHPSSEKRDLQVIVTEDTPTPKETAIHIEYLVLAQIGKMIKKDGCDEEDADVEWPATTQIWCHHCSHPFITMPLPIPIARNSKNRYIVKGVFCGVPCGLRYIEVHGGHDAEEQKMMFRQMVKEVFHMENAFKAHAAGDAMMLAVFGGMKTIEEFRNLGDSPGVTLKTLTAPFVQARMVMEQRGVPRSMAMMGSAIRNIKRPAVLPAPPTPDIMGQGLFDEFVKAHAQVPDTVNEGKMIESKALAPKKPRGKKAAVVAVANDEDTLMQFIAK